jgi:serine protease Do
MKKSLLTAFIIIIHSLNLFSQKPLRDFIVIVRPVFHEGTTEFLKKYSESLKKDGYTTESEYLKAYSEGKGFGSGFIIKGDDGKSYILTNRHVVMQADNATIEFSNTDGSKIDYHNCKIVRIDESNDLALLSFPEGAVINRALNFCTSVPKDGQEVYSAGFPGMGGKPSWQLGKGIISNSAFPMKTLDESIETTVIQHTAQIDRGSSGSPLLIADENEETGFSVIGLNTWKVFNRENVNLTIPVLVIKAFITKAISSEKLDNNSLLEAKSRKFVSDAMHGYKSVLKYVSYNYISKISVENFYSYWNNATKDAMKDISAAFEGGQPIEAVRIAIADAISQSIEKNKNTFTYVSISGLASYDTPTTVSLLLNNKSVNSSWIIEQDNWKLDDISCLRIKENSKNYGIAHDFTYSAKITPQLYISTSEAEKTGYGIDWSRGDKLFYGIGFYKFSHLAGNTEYSSQTETNILIGESGYVNYSEVTINLGYQYPFQLSKIYLVPFIKGYIGLNFGDISCLASHISYGLQTAYKLNNNHFVLLQIEIAPRSIHFGDFSLNNSETYNTILYTNTKFGGFNIGIGYTL